MTSFLNFVDKIKKKSEKRVASSEAFAMIDERAKWFKTLQEESSVLLYLEAYQAQQKEFNAKSEQYKGIEKEIPGLKVEVLAADQAALKSASHSTKVVLPSMQLPSKER